MSFRHFWRLELSDLKRVLQNEFTTKSFQTPRVANFWLILGYADIDLFTPSINIILQRIKTYGWKTSNVHWIFNEVGKKNHKLVGTKFQFQFIQCSTSVQVSVYTTLPSFQILWIYYVILVHYTNDFIPIITIIIFSLI